MCLFILISFLILPKRGEYPKFKLIYLVDLFAIMPSKMLLLFCSLFNIVLQSSLQLTSCLGPGGPSKPGGPFGPGGPVVVKIFFKMYRLIP